MYYVWSDDVQHNTQNNMMYPFLDQLGISLSEHIFITVLAMILVGLLTKLMKYD